MEVRIPFSNDIGMTESERGVLKFRFPVVKGNGNRKWKFVFVQSHIVIKRDSVRVRVFHSLDYSANGFKNTAVPFLPSVFRENIEGQSASCILFLRNGNLGTIRTVQLSYFLLLLNPS